MGYEVKCFNCNRSSGARNIVDLIDRFCDPDGWFVCPNCHQRSACVRKEFQMQENDADP